MAKVSVITPCYNLGRFLDEAVDSVLAQTFADFEILVVDDGSTDPETCLLLDRWSRPKTRLLRMPHAGVTAARNHALVQATGEYVTFFDADDRMRPEFLRKTVARLDEDSTLAFVSPWVHLFGGEEWDWQPEACDLVTLLGDCSVATAALVRRQAVLEVGGFDPAMELGHEDWDLWLTLVEHGHRGAILPEILFDYRRRERSRSAVADREATYLALFGERMRKHAASYRAHLSELLWHKERPLGVQLERLAEPPHGLDAAVAAQRAEVDRLRRALTAALSAELERTQRGLAEAHAEVQALRSSHSWKLTGPLRRALEWIRK